MISIIPTRHLRWLQTQLATERTHARLAAGDYERQALQAARQRRELEQHLARMARGRYADRVTLAQVVEDNEKLAAQLREAEAVPTKVSGLFERGRLHSVHATFEGAKAEAEAQGCLRGGPYLCSPETGDMWFGVSEWSIHTLFVDGGVGGTFTAKEQVFTDTGSGVHGSGRESGAADE